MSTAARFSARRFSACTSASGDRYGPDTIIHIRATIASPSGLSPLKQYRIPERGARMARREERAYREYVSEEQRSQPGCPARKAVVLQRRQATGSSCFAVLTVGQ